MKSSKYLPNQPREYWVGLIKNHADDLDWCKRFLVLLKRELIRRQLHNMIQVDLEHLLGYLESRIMKNSVHDSDIDISKIDYNDVIDKEKP